MPWFSQAPPIGLDVGSSMVKAVALRQERSLVIAERAGIAAMPDGAVS